MPTKSEKRIAKIPLIGKSAKQSMQLDRLVHKELWRNSQKYPRAEVPAPKINSINAWELHRLDLEKAQAERLKKVRNAIKARARKCAH